MKASIAEAVIARADDHCECGCGRAFGIGPDTRELDHFLSRRVEDSPSTIWALRRACHFERTNNRPDAATWLHKFLEHCVKHSFHAAYAEAFRQLQWKTQRTAFGDSGVA